MHKYFKEIISIIEKIDSSQNAAIEAAAAIIAESIAKGGIVHTFGAGHSSSVALEGFGRSGIFAQVEAILDPGLQFQLGAQTGTNTERLEGYMNCFLDRYDFREGDVFLTISNSGRNPAGIDAAIYAKKKGLKVIVITAYAAQKDASSRHSSGKKLAEYADVFIDNYASKDEATIAISNGTLFGPVSTVTGCAIINALYFSAAEKLISMGIKPDVYTSSNAGGDEGNAIIKKKVENRIRHLK